jgi:hypothetical protein
VLAAALTGICTVVDRSPQYSSRDDAQPKPAGDGIAFLFEGADAMCDAAMLKSGADGAALAVLTRSSRTRELVYASDVIARKLDELQYTIGEGPCLDAYLYDEPQYYPELDNVAQTSRWPTFAADATRLGVHALFALPIPAAQRPMGVLELYRRTAGSLAGAEYASAAAYAGAISQRLQSNWTAHAARFDSTEQAIDAAATAGLSADEPADAFTRTQIHIAGGVLAIQLEVDPDEAVDRLRAYSYAHDRPISSVAADIIARRLTLPD